MSTLRADTIANRLGTKSVPADTVVDGTAKAWVNFNGTGTVAIRRAFNVSSITDNGLGDYTVNFTAALPDANYLPVVTGVFGSNGPNITAPSNSTAGGSQTTTSCRIVQGATGAGGGGNTDPALIGVAIFS